MGLVDPVVVCLAHVHHAEQQDQEKREHERELDKRRSIFIAKARFDMDAEMGHLVRLDEVGRVVEDEMLEGEGVFAWCDPSHPSESKATAAIRRGSGARGIDASSVLAA